MVPPAASDTPAPSSPERSSETAACLFVLGTWLVLTVVASGFVTLFGNRTPRWEDWLFVPFVTGAQNLDLSWLWEDVQGHRVPILKLILCTCYTLFGFNSKPILYINVLLFSSLSLGLIWAIRKVRGRCCYADAFLPIVLLNLGQAEAFSWAQTFAYLSSTCLQGVLLILIATQRGGFTRTSIVIAVACLILLPFTFGGGVVYAAMMVSWLIFEGFLSNGRAAESRRHVRPVALGAALVMVMIVGFYFVGYRPLNDAPGELYVQPGLVVYAKTALKYLSSGFGGAAYLPFWQVSSFLIAVVLLAPLVCLFVTLARSRPTGDPRNVGLACHMVSCLAVAWVVGIGRYAWGNTIFDSRYSAASVVALLGSYFVWELYGPRVLVPLGRMIFFTAAAAFLGANFQFGYLHGRTLRNAERAYLHDLRAAEPIPRLVAHHSWVTYWYHGKLEQYLRQLRDAGIPPYSRLPADPSFRVQKLGLKPAEIHDIDWNGQEGKILGPDAYLGFDLDEPRFVGGLRFRLSVVDPSGMLPAVRVRVQSDTKSQVTHYNCRYESTTGEEAEILVYVDARISRVLLFPNNRISSFRMSNIELLLPG